MINRLQALDPRLETENTQQLLYLISSHLSGRKECRGVEYIVEIHKHGQRSAYALKLTPDIYIYPDRKTRKAGTAESVLQHIFMYHLNVKQVHLAAGTYKYMLSASGKCRKWTKIS